MKGKIVTLKTGITVVPFHLEVGNNWRCVVVHGSDSYPVGGYNIEVMGKELEEGKEVELLDIGKYMDDFVKEKLERFKEKVDRRLGCKLSIANQEKQRCHCKDGKLCDRCSKLKILSQVLGELEESFGG